MNDTWLEVLHGAREAIELDACPVELGYVDQAGFPGRTLLTEIQSDPHSPNHWVGETVEGSHVAIRLGTAGYQLQFLESVAAVASTQPPPRVPGWAQPPAPVAEPPDLRWFIRMDPELSQLSEAIGRWLAGFMAALVVIAIIVSLSLLSWLSFELVLDGFGLWHSGRIRDSGAALVAKTALIERQLIIGVILAMMALTALNVPEVRTLMSW